MKEDTKTRGSKINYNLKENQLGVSDSNKKLIPTIVPTSSNITKISAGYYNSLLLNNENKLLTMGFNNVLLI